MSGPLVLKDFGGIPEITQDAWTLKKAALEAARPVARVETPEQQQVAIEALQKLKEVRAGIEASRKLVKAPVLELGRKIDEIARNYVEEIERQYGRLSGLINHYQQKLLRERSQEELKLEQSQDKAAQLRKRAAELPDDDPRKVNLIAEAFDLEMNTELAVVPVPEKPKGLVVRNRINFQVIDPIVFAQAWPKYWKWNPETETLKLDRMRILDELNREDGRGDFHMTRFPEELPTSEDRRLVQPAGLRVYEETRAHLR